MFPANPDKILKILLEFARETKSLQYSTLARYPEIRRVVGLMLVYSAREGGESAIINRCIMGRMKSARL